MNRFDYVAYDDQAQFEQRLFKDAFTSLEELVEDKLQNGRAKALVLTALEEAYMWAGKSIRDKQIARLTPVPPQPQEERKDG